MNGMSSIASPSSVAKISAGDLTSTTSPGRKGRSRAEFTMPTQVSCSKRYRWFTPPTNEAGALLLAPRSERRKSIEVRPVEIHGASQARVQVRLRAPSQRLLGGRGIRLPHALELPVRNRPE